MDLTLVSPLKAESFPHRRSQGASQHEKDSAHHGWCEGGRVLGEGGLREQSTGPHLATSEGLRTSDPLESTGHLSRPRTTAQPGFVRCPVENLPTPQLTKPQNDSLMWPLLLSSPLYSVSVLGMD